MKRLSLMLLTVLVAACGGGAPVTTPTGGAPTPTSGAPTATTALPTPTLPDGETPPPDANAGACRLLTAAEVGQVIGEADVTVQSGNSTECSYAAGFGIPSVTVRFDSGESLDAARMILTEPEDISVAGNPAVFGEFMGHLLYVQEGDRVLVFQAIWGEEDRAAAKAKLSALAETALPRFPLP